MTEDEARHLIAERHGDDVVAQLAQLAAVVSDEAGRQNLIAPSTLDAIWVRHIMDSAQLLPMAVERDGLWIDVGTGAGFPGLVIAILRRQPMLLVEPRGRRATFLIETVATLGLDTVTVSAAKIEAVAGRRAAVISARAVAPAMTMIRSTQHLRDRDTILIFPRGRGGAAELANLPREWQAMFHVEHSLTDPESVILVANGVT